MSSSYTQPLPQPSSSPQTQPSTQPEYTWTPPHFSLTTPPKPIHRLSLIPNSRSPENFTRIAKWCADGSVLLAQCESGGYMVFGTPHPLSQTEPPPKAYTLPQPSPIVDFTWYPTATPSNPATYCFVSSVRERPVQLLDASDGRVRASYKIVDHRERTIAPHSVVFNLGGDKLYCGHEDAIEIFDVNRPGEGTRMGTTPSKRSKDGLKGIISALAFSQTYPDTYYAAGTLTPSSSNIAIFSELGNEPEMFLGGMPRAGVMQLRFNPLTPHILYASFRRNGVLYAWDLRSDVSQPLSILSVAATPKTNQKMWFDVDVGGGVVGVGDQEGTVSIFDLIAGSFGENQTATQFQRRQDLVDEVLPRLEFKAHGDSVGSVGFHPLQPALFTASGSRHFISGESMDYSDDVDDSSSSSSSSSDSEGEDDGSGEEDDGSGEEDDDEDEGDSDKDTDTEDEDEDEDELDESERGEPIYSGCGIIGYERRTSLERMRRRESVGKATKASTPVGATDRQKRDKNKEKGRGRGIRRKREKPMPISLDSSIKIWDLSGRAQQGEEREGGMEVN